ncbi:MAG TPA: folate-binding protein [Xanthomonadaceae bacterium]|jgi:folate-binding protein YgfZ|nr:folate-binding protein [Xanthomonadaceae bacterium]
MTDKQEAHSEDFPLPGWQVLEVAGPDAAAFLQAQTMNDVRSLMPGHWQWNGWLNPKGRLIALFALAALDTQRYWLIAPDFPAAELATRLQRFVFRSKVKLHAREDGRACGAFATPPHASGSAFHPATQGDAESIELDLGAEGGTRTLRIAASDATRDASAPAPGDADDDARRWIAFDLAHGLPRLPMEQSEQWTPQMLSLDRLNAYSLKKGCYPGQEIVARTHYLGHAKRVLARIAGNGLATGAEIRAGDRTLGSIVSSIGDEALAVLAADRSADSWECAGSPCRELPLRDGLAR